MSQQEVYDFLKGNQNTWFTSKDIAKALELSMGSVTCNLKKLRKAKAISFQKETKSGKGNYIYCFKESKIQKILGKLRRKNEV